MRRTIKLTIPQAILAVIIILATSFTVQAATGTTDAANAPAFASSYTLEDIYLRLSNGTTGSQSTFTEPAIIPGTGTMHDLNDIMSAAPALDNTNGATADQVLHGQTFWGLTNGEWGLQTGTISSGSDVNGADGQLSFNIPNGFYAGAQATANDSALLAKNIAEGVQIFGITGTYNSRFIEHNPSINIDTFTGLMWTQNADRTYGRRTYAEAANYCNTLNLAGYTDWHLPTVEQFEGLTHGNIQIRNATPHNFINVQYSYWTSTQAFIDEVYTHSVDTGLSHVNHVSDPLYVWCMRD